MMATAKFALLGAASGALYAWWNFRFLDAQSGDDGLIDAIAALSSQAGAGIFYGVIVGAALRRPLALSGIKWLALITAAALSYYAALNVAIALYDRQNDTMSALAGGAAGAAGALLLGLATALLSPLARRMPFFATTIAAGLLVGLLLPFGINADSLAMWTAFFALWQGAYAGAAAYATRIS
ncbi:MAG: hypothetical protein AB7R90_04585 [Reyranellaceae bacterium]